MVEHLAEIIPFPRQRRPRLPPDRWVAPDTGSPRRDKVEVIALPNRLTAAAARVQVHLHREDLEQTELHPCRSVEQAHKLLQERGELVYPSRTSWLRQGEWYILPYARGNRPLGEIWALDRPEPWGKKGESWCIAAVDESQCGVGLALYPHAGRKKKAGYP